MLVRRRTEFCDRTAPVSRAQVGRFDHVEGNPAAERERPPKAIILSALNDLAGTIGGLEAGPLQSSETGEPEDRRSFIYMRAGTAQGQSLYLIPPTIWLRAALRGC